MKVKERARFRRGAYLIPSLFTTGNLLCGYIAVVRSVQGEFEWAAIAVFIAALLDRVDGWVARLTGTTSDFGVQFDSLADVISFGIAPALLAYLWALSALPKPWSLAPFLYLATSAARLARFNIQAPGQDKRYFVGLPTPAAACAIAASVFYDPVRVADPITGFLVMILVVTLSILMVSKVRYRSFKEIDLRRRVRWVIVLVMALVFFVVAGYPQEVGLLLSFAYLLSGLLPRLRPAGRQEPRPAPAGGRDGRP
ncbi:MAG: CDP-diacylglycerol--serine O-phosphatidyltransferase [Acidobacteria bacterium]|nr:MAG: CDP-diacylglycerol--serine O-phosphatidyltransferase [Acidobacteria bacterium 13_1_40CM_2_68_10]OLE65361.1 MAG: CDP-diacylglycerol--serine O-phosphatidyltransferase [Acidobacteria bacterium 13_1_20CM_2_68_14]PYT33951.1 MAG: CDP-diacylglycerol--serine O-phosphatidyltransferase [Acidobacteriota bacterium]